MGKRYRLILLDCINTILMPDVSHLPVLRVEGRAVPSTAPLLLPVLERHGPPLPGQLTAESVHRAARAAWRWAEAQRGDAVCEVPAPRRFARLLAELGWNGLSGDDAPPDPDSVATGAAAEALAAELLSVHMGAVRDSYHLPAAHLALLERLRRAFPLALFSNFDHRPSLLEKLEELGIAGWFDPLIISDGLGYRKPGGEAFRRALELCGLPVAEVLMVGDSLEDDVAGALAAGLDVVWINHRGQDPGDTGPPTHELPALEALAGLLGL